jgi:hypothetical protein
MEGHFVDLPLGFAPLPEPKAIAGAFANLAPHIVQLAHDRENSLCSAGSATTPVSLAVRRSRTVALPKSPKLKVFSTIGIIRQYRITAPIVFEEFASFTRRVLELLDDQELTYAIREY